MLFLCFDEPPTPCLLEWWGCGEDAIELCQLQIEANPQLLGVVATLLARVHLLLPSIATAVLFLFWRTTDPVSIAMVFGNAVKPRQAKLRIFARVVRSQTFLLAQARINCKIVNNFASFSVVCKIKRATAHCTYKTNLTVLPQLTALNGKMRQTAFRCLLFSLPKSLCQRQALALPKLQKVEPVCVGLLKLQRANAKKNEKMS